uniref:Uncharacterized protein n=1 Tax=Anopheles dirus TaxID=7168 RepID=A0A182NWJ8_9DIPT
MCVCVRRLCETPPRAVISGV